MFNPKQIRNFPSIELGFWSERTKSGVTAIARKGNRFHSVVASVPPETLKGEDGPKVLAGAVSEAVQKLFNDMDAIMQIRCSCGRAYSPSCYDGAWHPANRRDSKTIMVGPEDSDPEKPPEKPDDPSLEAVLERVETGGYDDALYSEGGARKQEVEDLLIALREAKRRLSSIDMLGPPQVHRRSRPLSFDEPQQTAV